MILHIDQIGASGSIVQTERNHNEPVRVWVPSNTLVCLTIPTPTAPQHRWNDIIPWQLEDSLFGEPDHYCIGWQQNVAEQTVNVRAVSRSSFDIWRQQLTEQNLNAEYLVPDCFALEVNEQGWSALVKGDSVIVRTQASEGFTVSTGFFWQLVKRQLAHHEQFTLNLRTPKTMTVPDDPQLVEAVSQATINISLYKIVWEALEPPQQFTIAQHNNDVPRHFSLGGSLSALSGTHLGGYFGSTWAKSTGLAALLVITISAWLLVSIHRYDESSNVIATAISDDYLAVFDRPLKYQDSSQNSAQSLFEQATELSFDIDATQHQIFNSSGHLVLRQIDDLLSRCDDCALYSLHFADGQVSMALQGPSGLETTVESWLPAQQRLIKRNNKGVYSISFASDGGSPNAE